MGTGEKWVISLAALTTQKMMIIYPTAVQTNSKQNNGNVVRLLEVPDSSKCVPLPRIPSLWECRIVFIPLYLATGPTTKTWWQKMRHRARPWRVLLHQQYWTVSQQQQDVYLEEEEKTLQKAVEWRAIHPYTYALSALRAATDCMWAAEIYFWDWREGGGFLLGSGASSYRCYFQCLPLLKLNFL